MSNIGPICIYFGGQLSNRGRYLEEYIPSLLCFNSLILQWRNILICSLSTSSFLFIFIWPCPSVQLLELCLRLFVIVATTIIKFTTIINNIKKCLKVCIFFFFFFCVPMILQLASCQIWRPVALINSTVCVSLYSVPFSLSSRVEGFGQVCCQLCMKWAILEDVLSCLSDIATWTVGACTNFEFCMHLFLRRLCPERRRNIMV